MTDSTALLRVKLNAETGRLGWTELQRHFARGVVIKLHPDLDLVEAALRLHLDDQVVVQSWMLGGKLAKATDADAIDWLARQPTFWVVVAAPWVLVQEITA